MSKSSLKILETAEKLFNQNSFVGVGVDLIRDESGCSKTTLYTYYQNKNQLIQAVLKTRDARFKESLFCYIGEAKGIDAIHRIFDWHIDWCQQDLFKGCLFVRAVAESNHKDDSVIEISQQHKHWIKLLIQEHCRLANRLELSELIYTLIEGMISRFLVDGFDIQIAKMLKQNVDTLLMSSQDKILLEEVFDMDS